jgi:hypothetical protein
MAQIYPRFRSVLLMAALRAMAAVAAAAMMLLLDGILASLGIAYAPSVGAGLAIANLAAQVGIISSWVAIGRDPVLARLVASVMVLVGIWRYLGSWHGKALPEFGPGLLMAAVVTVSGLTLMRLGGFRLARRQRVAETLGYVGAAPRYSIRDIMAATALVGGALASVMKLGAMSPATDTPLVSCVIGAFLGTLTLLCVHAALIVRSWLLSSIGIIAAGTAAGWAIGVALLRADYRVFALVLGAAAAFQLGPMLLVRWAGYRLERARRTSNDGGTAGATGPLASTSRDLSGDAGRGPDFS